MGLKLFIEKRAIEDLEVVKFSLFLVGSLLNVGEIRW